jgi:hypothetical protein
MAARASLRFAAGTASSGLQQSEKKLAEQAGETGLRLHVSNALWGQNGYKFLPDFLNILAENYAPV